MIYYIILALSIIFILLYLFIHLLKIKIEQLEYKIIKEFKEKTNLIPSIYEVTKNHLNKHESIFSEILKLKKKDFAENTFYIKLIEKINTNTLIHNELNFIFRVCNKHPKLNKNWKFLYIRDEILAKSDKLSFYIKIYKEIINKYNRIINLKNLTIVWLFFTIDKKQTI